MENSVENVFTCGVVWSIYETVSNVIWATHTVLCLRRDCKQCLLIEIIPKSFFKRRFKKTFRSSLNLRKSKLFVTVQKEASIDYMQQLIE